MKQKTIIITGAASGIGKCCAKTLHKTQANLLLIDIQKDALEATIKEILQEDTLELSNTIASLCLDLSDPTQIQQLKETISTYEAIDGLIHCAGIMGEPGRCHELEPNQFEFVMKHQCYSAYYTSHAVLSHMFDKGGGSIVLVGGIGGLLALPHWCAYTTALHALSGLIKSLALDYGKNNIRVNGVLPSATHTPLYKKAQTTPQAKSNPLMKTNNPLQKVASTKEVSDVILFLLSPQASHVSGVLLPVDGGLSTY